MGQIRTINGQYYIEFYARGLLYSQPAGHDLSAAREQLRQVEARIAGGEALTMARHIDLPDFFERYLNEAEAQSYSPRSLKRYGLLIQDISRFLAAQFPQVRRLDQMTPYVAESYKVHLAKTQRPKITNFSMLLLRDILEYGIKLGFIHDNPCLHVRLLPWPGPKKAKITPRYETVHQLFKQGVGLGKTAQLMKVPDVARLVYFSNLIPLSREDVYN